MDLMDYFMMPLIRYIASLVLVSYTYQYQQRFVQVIKKKLS